MCSSAIHYKSKSWKSDYLIPQFFPRTIHYFMLTGICFSGKILNKHLALLAIFLSAQNQTHNYSSLWDPHLKKKSVAFLSLSHFSFHIVYHPQDYLRR